MIIDLNYLDKISGGYTLYDIRTPGEKDYGLIKGSVSADDKNIFDLIKNNSKSAPVIICIDGKKSSEIAEQLYNNGINAYSINEGYHAFIDNDLKKQSDPDFCQKVENSLRKKFRKSIYSNFIKALKAYKLVNEGDCVAVCISGGKDSMLMAKLFAELKRYSEVNFDVKYIVMDPGYNDRNRRIIESNAKNLCIPIEIFETDIFSSVLNVEKSPCYLCARMRRGHLYSFAKKLGCNKIALGHHFDDVIETILMGMLQSAQIQTMMPKLHSTNFEGMELIRPLYLIREDDIKAWRDYNDLHFLQCACKFTEKNISLRNGNTNSKRLETKALIKELKKSNPDVEKSIFRSVENVSLDCIISYKKNGIRHHFLDEYEN